MEDPYITWKGLTSAFHEDTTYFLEEQCLVDSYICFSLQKFRQY